MPFHVIIAVTAKLCNLKMWGGGGGWLKNKRGEYPGQDQVFLWQEAFQVDWPDST